MKYLVLPLALAAVLIGRSDATVDDMRTRVVETIEVDDPPPERDDCPLCGGDAGLHVKRAFKLAKFGIEATVLALRQ